MNIKNWILETQEIEDIKSISENGCVNGACNDLIYYEDTVKFYDDHKDEIWELLENETEQLGYKTVFEFMGTWSDYAENINSDTSFKNLLAWWSVENVCYQILNSEEVA
jgi:hypothetical protein